MTRTSIRFLIPSPTCIPTIIQITRKTTHLRMIKGVGINWSELNWKLFLQEYFHSWVWGSAWLAVRISHGEWGMCWEGLGWGWGCGSGEGEGTTSSNCISLQILQGNKRMRNQHKHLYFSSWLYKHCEQTCRRSFWQLRNCHALMKGQNVLRTNMTGIL